MSTIINGTSSAITFPDSTVQNTAATNYSAGGNITGNLNVSGSLGVGTTSANEKVTIVSSTTASYLQICDSSTGTASTDGMFLGSFSGAAELKTKENAALTFGTNNAERMRIESVGRVNVNRTTGGGSLNVKSQTNTFAMEFYHFSNDASVGSITTTTTSTSYGTSSDYRLKENVAPMQNALNVVQQLKPVTYTWKADGSDGEGFIAHELQAVVPNAVIGKKDAVDENGNPIYQNIDTSFLVATLTKAIQEQQAMIEELKAKVIALEAK